MALHKTFGCVRGTAANTFAASSAFTDELPDLALSPQAFRVTLEPPLSMAVLVGDCLLLVSGEERLTLRTLDIGRGREVAYTELGIWSETAASEVRLWLDRFRLWLWSERWLSCADIRRQTPQLLLPSIVSLPEGIAVIGAAFDLLWTEREGRWLEGHGAEQIVRGNWQPAFHFELPAPLQRFSVDRYSEASFVAGSDAIVFTDEQGNVWLWRRGAQTLQRLRESERILLLPIWMRWRERDEFVFVTERKEQAQLFGFDSREEQWREVPLLVRPSGSHAVVTGEQLWLPCEGGQRWVASDAEGKIVSEQSLPPQSRTQFAFALGRQLWALQEQGYVMRLFQVAPEVREVGKMEATCQPFVLGKIEGERVVCSAILRRRGKIDVACWRQAHRPEVFHRNGG